MNGIHESSAANVFIGIGLVMVFAVFVYCLLRRWNNESRWRERLRWRLRK